MRVAVLQSQSKPLDLDHNLDKLEEAAKTAASNRASILVTPELFVTGYKLSGDMTSLSQTISGSVVERAIMISREQEVALVVGYPELSNDGKVFNSAFFVDPKKGLIANYRKTHLYLEESDWFSAGEGLTAFEFQGLRIGLLICYDVEFPETVRQYAQHGIDLVIVPTALYDTQPFIANHVIKTRALESHVFIIYADHCGKASDKHTFNGRSSVIGPDGEPLNVADRIEQIIYADIDVSAYDTIRKVLPYLDDLRPSVYENRVLKRMC